MRIASFNAENLFERAKVLDLQSWAPGKPVLAAQAEINALFEEAIYTDAIKARILELLTALGLQRSDDSDALKPLIGGTDLRDISTHPTFDFGPRQGTFRSGNEGDKIDYVLLSPALFARATGGAVFRRGVWRGPRTRNPWPIYDTLTADVHAASDHAAIYADLGF
jgi:hypothetical protein